MPAQVLIPLIAQYGIPFATRMIQLWESKSNVTLDQWNALLAEESQTASDRMKLQLTAAGIDLNSPQAQALLKLSN